MTQCEEINLLMGRAQRELQLSSREWEIFVSLMNAAYLQGVSAGWNDCVREVCGQDVLESHIHQSK